MIPIKERTKQRINQYLDFFCSFDNKEYLLSFVDEEKKAGLMLEEKFFETEDESIFIDYFLCLHPENLARIFVFENLLLSAIIIDAMPERVKEKVCFYLAPELLPQILLEKEFSASLKEFIIFRFTEDIFYEVVKPFYTQGGEEVIKLITLSYEELFRIIIDAGKMGLESKSEGVPERTESIYCGYLLFAQYINNLDDHLKNFIMLKFPMEVQNLLKGLIQKEGEIKWLRQRSEEVFKRIL